MKTLLLVGALVLAAVPAFAENYVVVCKTACVAPDGTTQPAGTVLNRIVAPPTFSPGPGLVLEPDTGQALYSPTVSQ